MTINDLNMTEEQIVNEIQSMRLFDKYLQKMLGMEKYNELCLGFARMMTSAELKSFGASDEEIEKACNFADMMAIADEHKADAPQTETQIETQNSNLTFEKRTMRDCYNCKRYETEGECVECHYEPKDEPQTDCAWR